jgi:2-methylcitrate dehydratase PrpD
LSRNQSPILRELAEFAVGLSFDQLPAEVVRQVNRSLLDLFGCYFGGLSLEANHALIAWAKEINPKTEACLWGTGEKAGAAEASLVHGSLAHQLDYDDGISLGAHWGSQTIPALLAAAEAAGADGRELVTAVVAACEVGNRVSRLFSRGLLERGVHFPAAMAGFGAATGVARLWGFDAERTAGALGNGCLIPLAPYVPALSGAAIKDVYSGWPNFLGLNMVSLARAGWDGPRDLLEGPKGLAEILSWPGSAAELRTAALEGLGDGFEIMKTYFKPYPCCRWLHAPVKALLELKKEGGWTADQVAAIKVWGPSFLGSYGQKDNFAQATAARFSLPYVMAAAAWFGRLGLEEFSPTCRAEPGILDLAGRVAMEADPELESVFPPKYLTRVRVRLIDGRRWEKERGLPWAPEEPPTDEDLAIKFRYLAGKVLDKETLSAWQEVFWQGLETGPGWGRLHGLLQKRVAGYRSS